MKRQNKNKAEKDNRSYLEVNPSEQRIKALKALEKAKKIEAQQIAAGKKWHTSPDGKTSWLS